MKRLSLLFLTFIFTYNMFSQDLGGYEEYLEKFGVKIGVNNSYMIADPEDNKYISAVKFPYLGLFTASQLSKMFALQGELGYNLLGAEYDLFSNNDPIVYSLGYIALGALLKVYPVEQVGFNLGVGVQYQFLLFANQDDLDRLDSFKSSDFDILIGAGYNFDFGLLLELRYMYGLTNISNLYTNKTLANIKNSAIQIMTGWSF